MTIAAGNAANAEDVLAAIANAGLPVVSSIAGLRGLTTATTASAVILPCYTTAGDKGGGVFVKSTTDTTSGDDSGTIIVDAAGRRWKRMLLGDLTPFHFGAVGDGAANDWTPLQSWLNAVQNMGTITEGAAGKGYCPSGYKFLTSQSLTLSKPCTIRMESWIYYTPTTGSAFVIGSTAPTSGRNTGYDVYIGGLRALNGNNVSAPTGINNAGCTGLEVRNMQFSTLQLGEAIGFTYAGVYLNSTNNVYTPQHIQDNTIAIGQIAYNGYGIIARSSSAANGAVQVNDIEIQNVFSNWINMMLDDATFNGNTNDNTINCKAMDASAGGGSCYVYSSFNRIWFGYLNGAVACEDVAFNNRIDIGNPFGTGSSVGYSNAAGNNNWIQTITPNFTDLPATVPVAAGTAYQNAHGVPKQVSLTVTLTPTTSSAETATVSIGQISGSLSTVNQAIATSTINPQALGFPVSFVVPPGWWYRISLSGSGTGALSNALLYQVG